MFDIGFPELLIVSVVALIVIGPEKLPQTVRTLSLWIARFRRSLANIKMEIENEIGVDEIRQQIHNESVLKELKESKDQLEGIIQETRQMVDPSTPVTKANPTSIETNDSELDKQPNGSYLATEDTEIPVLVGFSLLFGHFFPHPLLPHVFPDHEQCSTAVISVNQGQAFDLLQ